MKKIVSSRAQRGTFALPRVHMIPPKKPVPELTLSADIGLLARDPLRFVRYAYPWGGPGELAGMTGPRDWQAELLATIRDALREGHETRLQPIRIAVASG